MRTRFYIEKRKDETGKLMLKDRPILMSVSYSGKRVVLGTGIKVDLHAWNPEIQQVKSSYPDSYASNAWLSTLSDVATNTLKALSTSTDDPDTEQFRNLFKELKPAYSSGFFDVFYQFLEANSSRWSSATYRKVRTIFKHLREFEDQTDYRLSFDNLDQSFLERFVTYYKDKGNSDVTTHKAINILVWFMNWATENGYNAYQNYRKLYKWLPQPATSSRTPIFLRWEELTTLREYNPGHRKLERAKDLFCFMCFTGVRYSELFTLSKEDVAGDEVVIKKKSDRIRRIPVNKFARGILKKYENKYYLNNTAFPSMSIVTLNKYLRILGQEAGLDRVVSSSKDPTTKVPVYKQLTAGIAVSTFIANAIELEIPPEIISNFTGVTNDIRIRRIKMDLTQREVSKFDRRESGL